MTTEPLTPEQEEIDAIERLAQTRDGVLIRRWFRRVVESCRVTEHHGVLQRQEGARILAREFMIHMDRGIPALARSNDPDAVLKPSPGREPGRTRREQRTDRIRGPAGFAGLADYIASDHPGETELGS